MTVSTSINKSGPYAGAGIAGPFTVGFRFLADSHLQVIRTAANGLDTTLTLTTDYTVSGAGGATGSVMLTTPLATGEKLTVVRNVPFTQEADYVNNDAFPAESHETALDLLTMQTQQLLERVDASLSLPASAPSGVSTQLPLPESQKIIGWDEAGTALVNRSPSDLATVVVTGTSYTDIFTPTALQTQFVLSADPGTVNALDVALYGVPQINGVDFTVSGTTLTMTTAPGLPPTADHKLVVRYVAAVPVGTAMAQDVKFTQPFTGAVQVLQSDVNQSWVTSQQFRQVTDPDDTLSIQRAVASGRPVRLYGNLTVTTVLVNNVNGIHVDASRATITSSRASAFFFNGCNDFLWTGGRLIVGDSLTGILPGDRWPFYVKNCSNARVAFLKVTCTLTYAYAPITMWSVIGGTVAYCQTENGGDNSIWCFFGSDLNIIGNTVIGNQRGRAITMQQVNGFTVAGNTVKDGRGDGISIHGSANGSVTGNTITNMVVDPDILLTQRGISIETDENANAGTIASAEANLYLYNGVYSRNITITGNTISNCVSGISFGSTTIGAGARGNFGRVTIGVNQISNCTEGINVGVARGVRISGPVIADMNNGGILVSFTPDAGGNTVADLIVDGAVLTNCNRAALGFNPVQVTGTWDNAKNVVFRNITFTDPVLSNASVMTLGLRSYGNVRLAAASAGGSLGTVAAVNVQAPIGDQSTAAIFSGLTETGTVREFVQSGQLGDAFATVLTLPADAALIGHVQIGRLDRVCQVGTIYAHNGTTPAFSFTGIGSGFAQISGANLQLRGNTSAGTANYGGQYTIRYTLLKAG